MVFTWHSDYFHYHPSHILQGLPSPSLHLFRYCQLEDPMARRHQQLEDSLRLHQFVHDVEDEQGWVRQREPQAVSSERGSSLTSVQNLLKKHQVCGMCSPASCILSVHYGSILVLCPEYCLYTMAVYVLFIFCILSVHYSSVCLCIVYILLCYVILCLIVCI